ncbi:MAG TPA: hypothetical protein VGP47_01665 [Parachlamydiaceae bacterium]|nr:hypothetical protein [Parachlamydiaceae bacterium]
MQSLIRTLALFYCLVFSPVFATNIESFYGSFDIEEPVLLELIKSPAFQRLKHIHQYGGAYYTTHREEYTRYDHSLGVFLLLRVNNCSLKEQISGLLHDVSHTIFSHVGDAIFKRQNHETDYQTLTHADYLERSGLVNVLSKYGYAIEEIMPTQELFPALEQPLPNLCADRLDYNIQGAFHQGFVTYEDSIRLFNEIKFSDGDWICNDHELLKKLVRFSIFMSQECWGSGREYVLSMWLAEAILRGLDIQLLSMEDIRFGIDQDIWERLLTTADPLIQRNMHMMLNSSNYIRYVPKEAANLIVVSKFRGIDPWVEVDGKRVRLTTTDPELAEEYQTGKERMKNGWSLEVVQ